VYEWQVAAGMCPVFGDEQNNEEVVGLWGGPNLNEINVIRVGLTPTTWTTGKTSVYSPMGHVGTPHAGTSWRIKSVVITARPFSDQGQPPSP
jgi:hypothetical protein